MGKYMKKAKVTSEVEVADAHHAQTSLGVLTRAKTLALKKSLSLLPPSTIITTDEGGDGCYLQLRSRRLERRAPHLVRRAKKGKFSLEERKLDLQKGKVGLNLDKKFVGEENNKKTEESGDDEKDEVSIGDKELESENKESTTRESTPISWIAGSEGIETPVSCNTVTTRGNTIEIMTDAMSSILGLEEIFAKEEKQQVEQFIEKYNFDPVKEKPLHGRYEWVKLKP
ncbi:hypothetical protein BUALT_Bualt14G0038900 [Buddleja alternifolia]|uniref:Cyclin-dependent kinase inhibitor domain-containing protein n=1 Tax=Buddleja alternifolia TaxID=168488 RepID=A0AAV6WPA1_9LAMI|nr:hypothetical protein BUALT_Bualt14G0038900 [Buddleja alternifolia]